MYVVASLTNFNIVLIINNFPDFLFFNIDFQYMKKIEGK